MKVEGGSTRWKPRDNSQNQTCPKTVTGSWNTNDSITLHIPNVVREQEKKYARAGMSDSFQDRLSFEIERKSIYNQLLNDRMKYASKSTHNILNWDKMVAKKKRRTRRTRSYEDMSESIRSNAQLVKSQLMKEERRLRWFNSLKKLDPRFQILMYFDEVARQGGPLDDPLAPPTVTLLKAFSKAAAFTVWRPTSRDAISKMMKGEATGKGMDVKGKSAKRGKLSGFIPFLQIHDNCHKRKVLWPPATGRIRIYFKNENIRKEAERKLSSTAAKMKLIVYKAQKIISRKGANGAEGERAMEDLKFKVDGRGIRSLSENGIGLDVPERVFFEAYINSQDINREGSGYETGRPSLPAFQDMNFANTRKYKGRGPRAVVYQMHDSDALCPLSLIVAYEEQHRVIPVVSDFDCFTLGTRGVVYDVPLPKDQVDLSNWLVDEIEKVLDEPGDKIWTSRWLDVLKQNAVKGFKPEVPEYGFGDPKSYAILEGAVSRFVHNKNGAVRHGAECFNLSFPQELDDQYLVVSETLPGELSWKYVNCEELKKILCEKIEEGFCFPLNPKWILVDKGWKQVYDKMMASKFEATQKSLETWYPPDSGIREKIEAIHARHPGGFEAAGMKTNYSNLEGMEAMNLAEDELRRYLILRRAKVKLRAALLIGKFGGKVLRQSMEELRGNFKKQLKIELVSRTKWKIKAAMNLRSTTVAGSTRKLQKVQVPDRKLQKFQVPAESNSTSAMPSSDNAISSMPFSETFLGVKEAIISTQAEGRDSAIPRENAPSKECNTNRTISSAATKKRENAPSKVIDLNGTTSSAGIEKIARSLPTGTASSAATEKIARRSPNGRTSSAAAEKFARSPPKSKPEKVRDLLSKLSCRRTRKNIADFSS